MRENPLISVVVPVYNAEVYLDRCITSIVNQTYTNLEIILINDGSSDSSASIIDSWAEKDSRIKVIHKENEGDVATRNMGLDIFSGEYVIMIDNDDYIDADMIEYLYGLCVENSADISRCGFMSFSAETDEGESVNYSEKITVLGKDDYEKKIIDLLEAGYNSGVVWNKLYSKSIISQHRMNKKDGAADDFLLNYRILSDNPITVISEVPKYHYLVRDDSMTGTVFTEGAFDIIRAKLLLLDNFSNNETVYPTALRSYILSVFIVLTGCIKNNYFNDSYKKMLSSFNSFYPEIKKSTLFTKQEKLKAFTLRRFPDLYKYLIRKKYGK